MLCQLKISHMNKHTVNTNSIYLFCKVPLEMMVPGLYVPVCLIPVWYVTVPYIQRFYVPVRFIPEV
jgi:hypothetical protein